MGTWTHGYDIVDWTRDLIYDNLKTDMGLKYVSVGSLAQHVMNAALSSDVPFVMVDIVEPAPQDVTTFQELETRYQIRILYIRRFASGEEAAKGKMEAIEQLANYIQDSQLLFHGQGTDALSLTEGEVTNMRLNGLEYTPPEQGLLNEAGQKLLAAAFNVLIHVQSKGS